MSADRRPTPSKKKAKRVVSDAKGAQEFKPAKRVRVVQTQARDTKSSADLHRGDTTKQSPEYIAKVQYARSRNQNVQARKRKIVGIVPAGTQSRESVLHVRDRAVLDKTHRLGYTSVKDTMGPPSPVAPRKRYDPYVDRPRTDAELKKFLKSGRKPIRVEKSVQEQLGKSSPTIGKELLAPAAITLRNVARPGHAVVAGLRGKNMVKGFKKGTDTGSDLLDDAGVKNKYVKAIGGFALDTVLFGGPFKASLRSPAKKLEEQAARAELRGKTARAAKLREKAKTAPKNRGVGVGATAGIPFTAKRFDVSVGETTTAKVAKRTGISRAGGRVHDSRVGQSLGRAFVPHFRHKDVDPETHARVVAAKRSKANKDQVADRKAHNRAQAYDREVARDQGDDFLRAVERAPVEPITAVRRAQRKTAAHTVVKGAERKVRTLTTKLAKETAVARELAKRGDSDAAKWLDKAASTRKALDDARGTLTAAKEAAKGQPRTVRVLVDRESGKPVKDVMAERPRLSPDDLKDPKARVAAKQMRSELDDLAARQEKAGVLEEGQRVRDLDYVSHMAPYQEPGIKRLLRRPGKGKPGHAAHRDDPRDIHSQNLEAAQNGKGPRFSTDPGYIVGRYTADAEKAINRAEYHAELKAAGKPVTKESLARINPETHHVYEITPKKMSHFETHRGELDTDEIAKRVAAGDTEDLVILPKALGHDELRAQVSKNVDGLFPQLGNAWDRATRAWKSGVTVWNMPFYQERNLYDDSLRSWMADTDGGSYARAMGLMEDHVKQVRGERQVVPAGQAKGTVTIGKTAMSRERFLREAEEDGVLGAGFYSELVGDEAKRVGKIGATETVRNVGAVLENVPRLATYLAARRRGMSRGDASSWVRVHHFDYNELTDVERAIRRFIPFYTFTSRNMQLQLRKLASRPGKYATIEAFREEAAKLADVPVDWEKELTETDQRSLPIPVRFGKDDVRVLMLGFSVSDLNRIPLGSGGVEKVSKQQFDLFAQMLNPFLKAPAEQVMNYSFFFRGPIYRDEKNPDAQRYVPAPDPAKNLPKGVRDLLGIKILPDKRTGKNIVQWPARLNHLVFQMPQTGFAATLNTETGNYRKQTPGDFAWKQATGLRRQKITVANQKGAEERIRRRLGELAVEIADTGDSLMKNGAPSGRSADGFYYTKKYQALLDEQKALREQLDASTGKVEKRRLARRPLTPAQQIRKDLEDFKKQRGGSLASELREDLERFKAERRLGP